MFKTIFFILFLTILTACSDNSIDEEKVYFNGQVVSTFPIVSKPSDEPIKGVKVELDSGNEVTVFVEKSLELKKGKQVTVFKYSSSAVHYLKR